MNCYNHPDRSALAICTSCGGGICNECMSPKTGLNSRGFGRNFIANYNYLARSNDNNKYSSSKKKLLN